MTLAIDGDHLPRLPRLDLILAPGDSNLTLATTSMVGGYRESHWLSFRWSALSVVGGYLVALILASLAGGFLASDGWIQ